MSKDETKSLDTDQAVDDKQPPVWVEWVRSIAIAVLLAMLIRWPVAEPYKIPSSSMEPTFVPGDRIFVDKHVYGLRWPLNGFRIPFTRKTLWYADDYIINGKDVKRWDIVVFKSVEEGAEHDTLVKRVVGLPGERILVRGGKILINGEAVLMPDFMPDLIDYTSTISRNGYLTSNGYGILDDDEHSLIPEGHYFLMGDNSNNSRDARWFGFLPKHHILGRVTSIWFPFDRWIDFTGYTQSMYWRGFWVLLLLYTVWRSMLGRSWKSNNYFLDDVLNKGDHVLVRFSLGIPFPFIGIRMTAGRALKRGDLVLHRSKNYQGDEEALLGIVAGLPGERVYLNDGQLKINDKAVKGPWDSQSYPQEGKEDKYGRSKGKEFSQVPDDHVYILSNDGHAGLDSRVLGWVSRKEVIGTVSHVWWPINRARKIVKATQSD